MVNKSEVDLYNKKYDSGYRSKIVGQEYARYVALKDFIKSNIKDHSKLTVLDYGSGNGLFLPLLRDCFQDSTLYFSDISEVALEQLGDQYPEYKDLTFLIKDDKVDLASQSFDVIVSIEVMEHVLDLSKYLGEINRLLKPGGYFIWTTPCGNKMSIEHLYSYLTNQIKYTEEGYRLWKWEDKTHVRRLKSKEIKKLLLGHGFSDVKFSFRSHFFSFFYRKVLKRLPFKEVLQRVTLLDYFFFRKLPNGASMLGLAKKS